MTITHITSLPELNKTLSASSTKVSVIDFHATWCGPCHAIAPTFEALSKQYKNVNFFKCDVDVAKDVAAHYTVFCNMTITHITSLPELNKTLSASSTKVSVIDFHATWCGPCHAIAPTFEALSKQYKNVNFFKCDVDVAKDVAAHYTVSAI